MATDIPLPDRTFTGGKLANGIVNDLNNAALYDKTNVFISKLYGGSNQEQALELDPYVYGLKIPIVNLTHSSEGLELPRNSILTLREITIPEKIASETNVGNLLLMSEQEYEVLKALHMEHENTDYAFNLRLLGTTKYQEYQSFMNINPRWYNKDGSDDTTAAPTDVTNYAKLKRDFAAGKSIIRFDCGMASHEYFLRGSSETQNTGKRLAIAMATKLGYDSIKDKNEMANSCDLLLLPCIYVDQSGGIDGGGHWLPMKISAYSSTVSVFLPDKNFTKTFLILNHALLFENNLVNWCFPKVKKGGLTKLSGDHINGVDAEWYPLLNVRRDTKKTSVNNVKIWYEERLSHVRTATLELFPWQMYYDLNTQDQIKSFFNEVSPGETLKTPWKIYNDSVTMPTASLSPVDNAEKDLVFDAFLSKDLHLWNMAIAFDPNTAAEGGNSEIRLQEIPFFETYKIGSTDKKIPLTDPTEWAVKHLKKMADQLSLSKLNQKLGARSQILAISVTDTVNSANNFTSLFSRDAAFEPMIHIALSRNNMSVLFMLRFNLAKKTSKFKKGMRLILPKNVASALQTYISSFWVYYSILFSNLKKIALNQLQFCTIKGSVVEKFIPPIFPKYFDTTLPGSISYLDDTNIFESVEIGENQPENDVRLQEGLVAALHEIELRNDLSATVSSPPPTKGSNEEQLLLRKQSYRNYSFSRELMSLFHLMSEFRINMDYRDKAKNSSSAIKSVYEKLYTITRPTLMGIESGLSFTSIKVKSSSNFMINNMLKQMVGGVAANHVLVPSFCVEPSENLKNILGLTVGTGKKFIERVARKSLLQDLSSELSDTHTFSKKLQYGLFATKNQTNYFPCFDSNVVPPNAHVHSSVVVDTFNSPLHGTRTVPDSTIKTDDPSFWCVPSPSAFSELEKGSFIKKTMQIYRYVKNAQNTMLVDAILGIDYKSLNPETRFPNRQNKSKDVAHSKLNTLKIGKPSKNIEMNNNSYFLRRKSVFRSIAVYSDDIDPTVVDNQYFREFFRMNLNVNKSLTDPITKITKYLNEAQYMRRVILDPRVATARLDRERLPYVNLKFYYSDGNIPSQSTEKTLDTKRVILPFRNIHMTVYEPRESINFRNNQNSNRKRIFPWQPAAMLQNTERKRCVIYSNIVAKSENYLPNPVEVRLSTQDLLAWLERRMRDVSRYKVHMFVSSITLPLQLENLKEDNLLFVCTDVSINQNQSTLVNQNRSYSLLAIFDLNRVPEYALRKTNNTETVLESNLSHNTAVEVEVGEVNDLRHFDFQFRNSDFELVKVQQGDKTPVSTTPGTKTRSRLDRIVINLDFLLELKTILNSTAAGTW